MDTHDLQDTLPSTPRAVALGAFDGIHIGHRMVITGIVGIEGMRSCVLGFSQPPWALPKNVGWELFSANTKNRLLQSLGVTEFIAADFEQIRHLSPAAFVQHILYERLCAKVVSCGFNYHFGAGGIGDASMLRTLCAPLGIEVRITPPVMMDGQPVSASRIRQCIEQGDMQQATRLLGYPFTLDVPVVGGQQLGRLLGTPTINQPLPPHLVCPKFGVYASSVEVNGRVTHGVTNIGIRPTVGADAPLAETWIADFEGDLYGQTVPVSLVKFLRSETQFPDIEALQKQILRDAEQAADMMTGTDNDDIRAVFFDFDDTLQDRNQAFLAYCNFFMEKYFPAISPQEKETRIQEMLVRNKGGYVDYLAYFTSLCAAWQWDSAPSPADLYQECQWRFPEFTCLFSETKSVLAALRARGLRLGIITNGPSLLQNRKLDVSGLRALVDLCVVSGDEGVYKPAPEIFRRAAARLGVPVRCCVYVGDHPVNDIQGAIAAGMRPIFISTAGFFTPPDQVTSIDTLQKLLDVI